MGATDIYNSRRAKDMLTAYESLCSDAEDEYGHQQGYNGTISTTSGFIDKTSYFNELLGDKRKTKKWVTECRVKFEDEAIENTQKWGPVWGIEVPSQKSTKKSKLFYFVGWAAE
jgi:hypothetical protein